MGTQPGDGIDGAQYRNPRLELGAADYIVEPFSPMEWPPGRTHHHQRGVGYRMARTGDV